MKVALFLKSQMKPSLERFNSFSVRGIMMEGSNDLFLADDDAPGYLARPTHKNIPSLQ